MIFGYLRNQLTQDSESLGIRFTILDTYILHIPSKLDDDKKLSNFPYAQKQNFTSFSRLLNWTEKGMNKYLIDRQT